MELIDQEEKEVFKNFIKKKESLFNHIFGHLLYSLKKNETMIKSYFIM